MSENLKPIPGYEGLYLARSDGRIVSQKRATTKGGVLKEYVNNRNGYCYVTLCKDNKPKSLRVHRLIALAFFGEPNGLQVNHKNGNKKDNRIENLEYCTQSENMIHAYYTGLCRAHSEKVIDLDTLSVYDSVIEAARSVGGSKANSVSRVCMGIRSQYRNHRFAYLSDYENGTIPEFRGNFRKRSAEVLWR